VLTHLSCDVAVDAKSKYQDECEDQSGDAHQIISETVIVEDVTCENLLIEYTQTKLTDF